MIPFVLGAIIGGVAATALSESKIGKKISQEGSKLIDTLDDRITAFAKKVDKDRQLLVNKLTSLIDQTKSLRN